MAADLDIREQLCNDRLTGPAHQIALPRERITRLHGIVFDIDPKLLRPDNTLFPPADDPTVFYANIQPVLDRHPLARFAEVRLTGTGLHPLLWLEPAVELRSEADQERWDDLIRAVQATLPSDPSMPGITALTRQVGAVNSKNGVIVTVLRKGTPIAPEAVEDFARNLIEAPFRVVALPPLGAERTSPCPGYGEEGSSLAVDDQVGHCYGGCSKVTVEKLFEAIFRPPLTGKQAEDPAAGKKRRRATTAGKAASRTRKRQKK
jgi:hypothetical protein